MGGISHLTAFVFGMVALTSLVMGTICSLISLNNSLTNLELKAIDEFNPYKSTKVKIEGINIVRVTGTNNVQKIEINLTNLGYMPISIDELSKIDLIIKYVKNIGEGKNVVLEDRVIWIPYDKACLPTNTCWTLDSNEPVYNDKINQVNINEEYGLIDKGEKGHIVIYFDSDDYPYYDDNFNGYFVFIIALKDGMRTMLSIINLEEVVN